MAILEDVMKGGNVVTGLAIGVGAAVLGPMLMPVIRGVARPVAKAAIRGGMMVYEKGREAAAEVNETVQDLVAETRAEMTFEGLPEEEEKTAGKGEREPRHPPKAEHEAKPAGTHA